MNYSVDWDGPGEQDGKVEPNLERDWCAVIAMRLALALLDKHGPDETVTELATSGPRRTVTTLTKEGRDISYIRMVLDLYRNTDFPDEMGNPFAEPSIRKTVGL